MRPLRFSVAESVMMMPTCEVNLSDGELCIGVGGLRRFLFLELNRNFCWRRLPENNTLTIQVWSGGEVSIEAREVR